MTTRYALPVRMKDAFHIDAALISGAITPALERTITGGACGAQCVFVGRTRAERHPEFGDLCALEYEAYEEMAIPVLQRLAREALEESCAGTGAAAFIRHSTGFVPVGDASVIIDVHSPHRGAAFHACRCLIDQLKRQVPIWKREHWERGHSTWSPAAHSPESRAKHESDP